MKLLYVIPSFQHPKVRGPNRHYHLVRELSARHDITLLALNRTALPQDAVDEMASYVKEMHVIDMRRGDETIVARQIGRLPAAGRQLQQMLLLRDGVKRMKQVFNRLVSDHAFDVLVFHGKSIFPVIEGFSELPLVVDFCDATSMRIKSKARFATSLRRVGLWWKHAQMQGVEQQLLAKSQQVAFISPRDREAILGTSSGAEILPNGVDHDYWQRRNPPSTQNSIVFTGVMDYAPNHDAAIQLIDRIAPIIRKSIPDLQVYIVGRDPAEELRRRADTAAGIHVTGFVDDVRPFLEQTAVFAAPLRYASGTQNKVLEAMSMQIPVVTTSVVADGLRMDNASDPPVWVANDDSGFAQAVIRLLGSPQERDSLAARGRQFVEQHFIWSRSAEKLERMCETAMNLLCRETEIHTHESLGVTT